MSFRLMAIALLGAFGLALNSPAQAQTQRIEQEDLLITDPTVAANGKWLIGASGEGWYAAAPYTVPAQGLSPKGKGNIKGGMYGGGLQVGYDDLWLQVNYLNGTFTGTERRPATSVIVAQVESFERKADELEVIARYAFRDVKIGGITPFIIAIYDDMTVDAERNMLDGSGYFIWSGTPRELRTTKYRSAGAGIGGLTEFTENTGMRFNVVMSRTWATEEITNAIPAYATFAHFKGAGFGGMAHVAGYYRLTDSLTVQVGLKAGMLYAKNVASYGFGGGYINLGWIHRF